MQTEIAIQDETPTEAFNEIEECSGCGVDLPEDAACFRCTGCGELFCDSHKIAYGGEEACADCALFWAQEDVKKLRLALAKRVDARLRGKS
jgi:hypothetical protein